MKEDAVKEIWTWLQGTIEQMGALAQEELPGFVQEIIRWRTAGHVMGIVIEIILVVILVQIARKCLKGIDETAQLDAPIRYVVGSAFSIIGGVIFTCCFIVDLYGLVQIIIAPRVYLLEYTLKLMRHE